SPEAREARALGIPLVPADEHRNAAEARVEIGKSEVARREIEFLEVKRVVGDMHLAVFAKERSIGVYNCGSVVINTGGAALEQRPNDGDVQAAREFRKGLGRRPRNRFREFKEIRIFLAAEILRAKQFLQANDLGAARGGLANTRFRLGKVLPRIGGTAHLDQADCEFPRHVTIIASSF